MENNIKNIWKKILGIMSHVFTFGAVFLTAFIIGRATPVFALIYLIIFLSWYITIFWAYCSRCPCHFNCTHVYMGRLASKIFKTKRESSSSIDYPINNLLLIAVLIYPQYWLKDNLYIFSGFWLVMIAMGPLITPLYCPECENTSCPVHRLFKRV